MDWSWTLSKILEPNSQWDKDVPEGTLLVQRVIEYLRKKIMEGELPPETQLPNEPDLSSYLNISRSTVRSALAILEQGGFIQRRWGVGTFVTKNPPTYNNLSLNSGVTQLIRSSGAEPGSSELLMTTRPASERVSAQLAIELGTPTLVIERVRLANDKRAVFTVDVFRSVCSTRRAVIFPWKILKITSKNSNPSTVSYGSVCRWRYITALPGFVPFLLNNISPISFKYA